MMDVSSNLRYGVRARPTVGLVERQGEIDWLVGGLRLGKRRYMSFWADLDPGPWRSAYCRGPLGARIVLERTSLK
jgi:hypothetical protein